MIPPAPEAPRLVQEYQEGTFPADAPPAVEAEEENQEPEIVFASRPAQLLALEHRLTGRHFAGVAIPENGVTVALVREVIANQRV